MFHAICEADVLAKFAIDLGRHSFVYNALDRHIFDDIFEGNIKWDHILEVLNDLTVFFKKGLLLEH